MSYLLLNTPLLNAPCVMEQLRASVPSSWMIANHNTFRHVEPVLGGCLLKFQTEKKLAHEWESS